MAYIGNFLLTRLAQNLDLSSTSMTVTSGDGAKFGAEMIRLYGTEMFPYYLIIRSQAYGQAVLDPNREIVQVTARDEDTFTIARGTRGTTAVAHSSGDYVQLSLQADDLIFPETTVRRLDPNLCLYLPFEEGTGTMTKDLSGWGNHGTLVNGPTWSTGRAGKCLNFDGSDDYVDVNDFQLGGEITVEGWVYPTAHQNWQRMIDFGNGEYADNIILAASNGTTGKPAFDVYIGGTVYTATSPDAISLNSWHFLVGVLGGGRVKLYVDNVLKGDVAGPSGLNNLIRTNNYIGRSNWSADAFFKGLIDEVRIYNRALSESEIQDHYLNP